MRMMSCGKWAPLKLIIRALPYSSSSSFTGRSYLKSRMSKIRDRALILGHKRLLLGLLFTAASQTLLQCGRHNLGGQLGGMMVLHTWDQLLKAHFHVHCLVPGGALADDHTRWVPTHPAFLFPVKALGTVFRAKFLEALAHAHTTAALTFSDTTAALATPQGFARLLDHLYATAWVVYAK